MESKWKKVDGTVGLDEIDKTVGIGRSNEIDVIERAVLI